MRYYSVKECIDVVGKSNSTIRRFIKELKDNETQIQKNYTHPLFRYEDLRTNHQKIYILEDIILKYFDVETMEEEVKEKEVTPINNDLLQQTFNLLDKQLEEKGKTIDTLLHNQSELIERQRELHILLKKSEERVTRLEEYFGKNKPQLNHTISDVEIVVEETKNETPNYPSETLVNTDKVEGVNTSMNNLNDDIEEEVIEEIKVVVDDGERKSFSDWLY